MESLPILYSFRRCPFAIRARLALRSAGIQVSLREVVLRDKPQALREASPKATVPVLQLSDGRVIEESLDIMEWALGQADPEGWLRTGDAQEGRALIDDNDGPFKVLLDKYKYPHRELTGQDVSKAALEAHAHAYRDEAVARYLRPLEERLQTSAFLLAESPALADMALMPFVRQFAKVEDGWFEEAPLPYLRRWLTDLTSSALFESVMIKFPAWKPDTPGIVF